MYENAFDGLVPMLIGIGVFAMATIWGCWELVDLIFIDDAIRVSTPIVPELELRIINNVVDTVYVYRMP